MSSAVPRIKRASNVPRPPHPIRPTLSRSLAPNTLLADTAVHAATPAPAVLFKKSRLSMSFLFSTGISIAHSGLLMIIHPAFILRSCELPLSLPRPRDTPAPCPTADCSITVNREVHDGRVVPETEPLARLVQLGLLPQAVLERRVVAVEPAARNPAAIHVPALFQRRDGRRFGAGRMGTEGDLRARPHDDELVGAGRDEHRI